MKNDIYVNITKLPIEVVGRLSSSNNSNSNNTYRSTTSLPSHLIST